jgi:hypothetical protein
MTQYLRHSGFGQDLPYFWYDTMYAQSAYASLQSLYLYGYTFVGSSLPKIDEDFRTRMRLYQPTKLVLLCADRRCSSASAALARGGYRTKLLQRHQFRTGPFALLMEIREVRPMQPSAG